MIDVIKEVLKFKDEEEKTNKSPRKENHIIGYEPVFHASEICCQPSPVTSNINNLNNLIGDLSTESHYLLSDSGNSVSFEMGSPVYSVSAGSKPLSLIIKRCSSPVDKYEHKNAPERITDAVCGMQLDTVVNSSYLLSRADRCAIDELNMVPKITSTVYECDSSELCLKHSQQVISVRTSDTTDLSCLPTKSISKDILGKFPNVAFRTDVSVSACNKTSDSLVESRNTLQTGINSDACQSPVAMSGVLKPFHSSVITGSEIRSTESSCTTVNVKTVSEGFHCGIIKSQAEISINAIEIQVEKENGLCGNEVASGSCFTGELLKNGKPREEEQLVLLTLNDNDNTVKKGVSPNMKAFQSGVVSNVETPDYPGVHVMVNKNVANTLEHIIMDEKDNRSLESELCISDEHYIDTVDQNVQFTSTPKSILGTQNMKTSQSVVVSNVETPGHPGVHVMVNKIVPNTFKQTMMDEKDNRSAERELSMSHEHYIGTVDQNVQFTSSSKNILGTQNTKASQSTVVSNVEPPDYPGVHVMVNKNVANMFEHIMMDEKDNRKAERELGMLDEHYIDTVDQNVQFTPTPKNILGIEDTVLSCAGPLNQTSRLLTTNDDFLIQLVVQPDIPMCVKDSDFFEQSFHLEEMQPSPTMLLELPKFEQCSKVENKSDTTMNGQSDSLVVTKETEKVVLIQMSHSGRLLSTTEVSLSNNEVPFSKPFKSPENIKVNTVQTYKLGDNLHAGEISRSNIFNIIPESTETHKCSTVAKISNPTSIPQILSNILSPSLSVTGNISDKKVLTEVNSLETSPLLFTSDDDSPFNTELEQDPGSEYGSCSDRNETIAFEQSRLNRLQELLSGVPPPPSVTIPQYTVSEILTLLKENQKLMSLDDVTKQQSSGRKGHLRVPDILATDWPSVATCHYYDIQYNNGTVSEGFEAQCQRLQQRFVGSETSSSCNIWCSLTYGNKQRCRKRPPGQSPGRRLSHLARRRRIFSSSNLQNQKLPSTLPTERRMFLMEVKKTESRRPSSSKKNVAGHGVKRKTSHSKINSSKRALFQSPTEDNKKTSSSKKSKFKSRNHIDRNKVHPSRRALFSDSSEASSTSCGRFNENGKRDRDESEEVCRRRSCVGSDQVQKSSAPSLHTSYQSDDSDRISDSFTEVHAQSTSCSRNPKKELSSNHKKKLLWAVAEALKGEGIGLNHPLFRRCATSLASICRRYLLDLLEPRTSQQDFGSTSERMLKLAYRYVAKVVKHKHGLENVP